MCIDSFVVGVLYHLICMLSPKRMGIKSLINLQHPGEHVSCGFGIDPVSGFSYDPEDFMKDDSMYCSHLFS